jgi:hypothetical protein
MFEPFKNIFCFFCISAATAVSIAAFNFSVDPLQIFRAAQFYKPAYPTEERLHNAGLIRSQNFDTVFVGDSIGLHVRSSEIDHHLSTRSVKLAASGASSREQKFFLSIAFERNPKRVLWEMDDLIFVNAPDIDDLPYLPVNLYRKNLKGISGYLFSLETSREALWLLLRTWRPFWNVSIDLMRAGYLKYDTDSANELNTFTADIPSAYNAERALAAYKYYSMPGNGHRFSAGYTFDVLVKNFERDAIGFIQNHPNIDFTIYFPPYSMVQYAAMRDFGSPDMLPTFYRFSSYSLQRLSQLTNVTLFDFRDVAEITHNLGNYADAIHHTPAIGELLLSFIANGKHAVDKSSPAVSVEQLKKQVESYRVNLP